MSTVTQPVVWRDHGPLTWLGRDVEHIPTDELREALRQCVGALRGVGIKPMPENPE